MKKIALFLAAAALVALLGGCAELFEFNLFSALDGVRLPDKASLEAMPDDQALDYLEEQLGSAKFTDALASNPNAAEDVRAYLDDAKGTASTPEEQRATVLSADLYLKTTRGEEVVNNVASLFGDVMSSGFGSEQSLADLIVNVVPADLLGDQAAFNAMLDGFDHAWTDYESLGLGMDPADVPPEINIGDVTQKALFSFVIHETMNNLYTSPAEAKDALWTLAHGGDPADPTGTFTDPINGGVTALDNLFQAAGATF